MNRFSTGLIQNAAGRIFSAWINQTFYRILIFEKKQNFAIAKFYLDLQFGHQQTQ